MPLACHPSFRLKQSADKHTVPGSGQVPIPVREPWNPGGHLVRVGGGGGENTQGVWLVVFFFRPGLGFFVFWVLFFFKLVAECISLNWISLGKSSPGSWRSRAWQAQGLGPQPTCSTTGLPRVQGCVYSNVLSFLILPRLPLLSPSDLCLTPLWEEPAFPWLLSRSPAISALLFTHCLALLTSVLLPAPRDRAHRAFHTFDQTALWPTLQQTGLLCLLLFSIWILPHRKEGRFSEHPPVSWERLREEALVQAHFWVQHLVSALQLPQANPSLAPNPATNSAWIMGKHGHFWGGMGHLFAHTLPHHRKAWCSWNVFSLWH